MYLPPRNSGATVHEYLTPGVEIVSVDPNCAYNSPISLSDTSVSDLDDDECCSVGTDDYLLQMNQQQQQHPHALDVVDVLATAADNDDDDEEEEDDFDMAVLAGINSSPGSREAVAAMTAGNRDMCATTSRSQACLGKPHLTYFKPRR